MAYNLAEDELIIESAVPLTDEQKEANRQYFSDNGLSVDVENVGDSALPDKAPAPEPTTPPETAEPTVESTEAQIEALEQTLDGLEARPVGDEPAQRLGSRARKTKEINDLKAAAAEKDAEIAELRRKVSETAAPVTEPAAPAAPTVIPSAISPIVPPASPEPIVAKQFGEPKPVRPVPSDFFAEDDPNTAYLNALGEYTDKSLAWNEQKRNFDAAQQAEVAQRTTQTTQVQSVINQRWQAVQTAHPDFIETLNRTAAFPDVMNYVLREQEDDGFEIAYQLAKPENASILQDIRTAATMNPGETAKQVEGRILAVTKKVDRFRVQLESRSRTPIVDPPAPPAARAAQPAPPPATPPRIEEGAPAPLRGRAAPAQRIEDIDPYDADARMEFLRRQGEL